MADLLLKGMHTNSILSYLLKCKGIKKWLKISIIIIVAFLAIGFGGYYLLITKPVQNIIGKRILTALSDKTGTTIEAKDVSFRHFKELEINNLYIEDENQDTLIFATKAYAILDSLNVSEHYVSIKSLELSSPIIKISQGQDSLFNFAFIIDSLKNEEKPDSLRWNVVMKNIIVSNGDLGLNLSSNVKYKLSNLNTSTVQEEGKISIDALSFDMSNGFLVSKANAEVITNEEGLTIPYISLVTPYSSVILKDLSAISGTGTLQAAPLDSIHMSFQSNNSVIGGEDISFFLDEDLNFTNDLIVDGSIEGSMLHLVGDDLRLKVEDAIDLKLSFDLVNALHMPKRHFNLDLDYINIDVAKSGELLSHFAKDVSLDISSFSHWEEISYYGNVSGMHNNINCLGYFITPFGDLNTDLNVIIADTSSAFTYEGNLSTDNFRLGNALQQTELIGDISTSFFVSGIVDAQGQALNYFSGDISDFTFKDYAYTNISMEASLNKDFFSGLFDINDPNAMIHFDGDIDFGARKPVFNFDLDVERVDLSLLNLVSGFETMVLDFNASSHLLGASLDSLKGYFNFNDISVVSEYSSFAMDSLDFVFKPQQRIPSISISSDIINVGIIGSYNFKQLPGYINNSLQKHMSHLPLMFPYDLNGIANDFSFKVEIDNLNELAKVFNIPIESNGFSFIEGYVNSNIDDYAVDAFIPYVMTNKQLIDSITLSLHGDYTQYQSSLIINHLNFGGEYNLDSINLNSVIVDDTVNFTTFWNNEEEEAYSGILNSKISLQPYGKELMVVADVLPSEFILSDSLWGLNSHRISVLPNNIDVDSLRFYKDDSYLLVDGAISNDVEDVLSLNVNDLDLKSIDRFLSIKNFTFEGLLSGQADFYGLLDNPILESNITIEDISLNHSYWGDLHLQSEWDADEQKVNLDMICLDDINQEERLSIRGDYSPEQDSLAMKANFNKFTIDVIRPYIEPTLMNLHVIGSGDVDIKGSLKSPELYGGVLVDEGSFRIDYLSTDFTINDTVYFDNNRFVFKETEVQDQEGNYGYVTGDITHRAYKNMIVDLLIESDRFLGLNTTSDENEYFYGSVYFDGVISIRNNETQTLIGSSAKTAFGSHLTVPLSPVSTAASNDFITYITSQVEDKHVDTEKLVFAPKPKVAKQLIVDMDFDLTPDIQVVLEFDAQSGDLIEANGNGNLNIQFTKGQPFQMFGEYEILKGRYVFTMQQIVNKPFDVVAGSTMRWSGRPGDAIMDIDANYSTRASLYNLMPDAISESNKTRRVPVNIKLLLDQKLSQPDISFDIELPNTDEETKQSVSSIINSEEEMNRQVLSLLIMNSFYTPDYYNSGTTTSTNNQLSSVAAVTVSEFLSNQLSSWVSQINDNIDLGFRYMPQQELTGEGLSPEEYEMAISTQFFDDRLTVNGNMGYQNYQTEDINNNFVGEVDVELKLNEHVKVKAYSHQNDDILYENSNMKQGAGLSYEEDFSTIKELCSRYKTRIRRLFKSKDEKNSEAIIKEEDELEEDISKE